MIYQNARPVTVAKQRSQKQSSAHTYEWRDFLDDSQDRVDAVRARFKSIGKKSVMDRFFLLPGRPNQIAKIKDNDIFEIKTLVDAPGPLELWETTVQSEVPLRRTLAKRIAARIPKFSGPVVGSMSAEELSDSLSRKTRYFEVKSKRETLKRGSVTARISRARIEDRHAMSIAFHSQSSQDLQAELDALGLDNRASTNFGEFLLHAA